MSLMLARSRFGPDIDIPHIFHVTLTVTQRYAMF